MIMGSSENSAVLDTSREDQDIALVRRFLAGEESAFDELVARHQSYVYNLCLSMLGNPSDAEDAAQDVFVAVYKGLPGFRMQSKVLTWVHRIAMNQCVSNRRKRREEIMADGEIGESPCPVDDREKRREVRRMLQQVAPHYRGLLVLKYYREFSYEEIGEIMGWSSAKVKCYLHRARNVFRRVYEAESAG